MNGTLLIIAFNLMYLGIFTWDWVRINRLEKENQELRIEVARLRGKSNGSKDTD